MIPFAIRAPSVSANLVLYDGGLIRIYILYGISASVFLDTVKPSLILNRLHSVCLASVRSNLINYPS
jgi:hypothetical protein